jgi:ABC-2 type transport system ATP-binding protein
MEAIQIQDLSKSFGELLAVDGISLKAEAGQIYGLLGPNGAGKSTTIGCLCGLVTPSAGHVAVMGRDVVRQGREAKALLGVVPQELALYEDLTAPANLAYWGAAYGLRGAELKRRVWEVLERIELADRAKEAVKNFSGGMQRRLNFGCAIVHRPQVLLLDEPTVGVDPQSRRKLLELVRELAAGGTCVLYTTHYMEEAQELCDRLGIIDHGKLIAEGTLGELRGLLAQHDLLRLTGAFDPDGTVAALAGFEGLEVVSAEVEALMLSIPGASRQLPALFDALARAGMRVGETTLTQPSLESLFIKLTGRDLRE